MTVLKIIFFRLGSLKTRVGKSKFESCFYNTEFSGLTQMKVTSWHWEVLDCPLAEGSREATYYNPHLNVPFRCLPVFWIAITCLSILTPQQYVYVLSIANHCPSISAIFSFPLPFCCNCPHPRSDTSSLWPLKWLPSLPPGLPYIKPELISKAHQSININTQVIFKPSRGSLVPSQKQE